MDIKIKLSSFSRITSKLVSLGKPTRKKSAVFLNIVQKAFDPSPPFYLNICPILQGVFFKRVFAGGVFKPVFERFWAPHI